MKNEEAIKAVGQMQDYIANNLDKPITLYTLSKVAEYSPYYCTRLFKKLVGKSPFEYIRALRLTNAALTLRDESRKIIDVAFDYEFDSHEGFTRAFSKEFGITPYRYSKNPIPIRLFLPYSILDKHIYFKNKGKNKMEKNNKPNTIFVQVVERPARKLILKRGKKATDYLEYCEEVGCDIWGILSSVKEALYEPIGMWLPKSIRPEGTSEYSQGVEVPTNYDKDIPVGFEIISLSPCKMMVFQGQPYKDELFEDAILELQSVIKDYKPEIYGFKWADEDAPRFQLEPQGNRGYIEARPVRSVNS